MQKRTARRSGDLRNVAQNSVLLYRRTPFGRLCANLVTCKTTFKQSHAKTNRPQVRRPAKCSAELRSAVSPNSVRQAVRKSRNVQNHLQTVTCKNEPSAGQETCEM